MQLHNFERLPTSLVTLLGRSDILKVGRSIGPDVKKLRRDFSSSAIIVRETVDIGDAARSRGIEVPAQPSLQLLTRLVLREHLPKPESLRLYGQWCGAELSAAQAEYAALDAVVAERMWRMLSGREIVNVEMDASALPGSQLAIRAGGDRSVIVARGHVVPRPPPVPPRAAFVDKRVVDSKPVEVVLTSARLYVSITEVRNDAFIIEPYKSPLRSFGAPPFLVVVDAVRCFSALLSLPRDDMDVVRLAVLRDIWAD